jgi:hypothetical protein
MANTHPVLLDAYMHPSAITGVFWKPPPFRTWSCAVASNTHFGSRVAALEGSIFFSSG